MLTPYANAVAPKDLRSGYSPRMESVNRILDGAVACDDEWIAAVARRLIRLNRVGQWDSKAYAAIRDFDYAMV